MSERTDYLRARRRVEAIRGFNVHATIYVVVNLILIAIDLLIPGELWFYWPLIGWGVWLAAHGASVYSSTQVWGPDWEDRKVRQILGR